MNKRLVKYFWALPLLGMLSSCSDSATSEGSQNANYAVNFAVSTSKQSGSGTKSRAFIVDNDAVTAQDFGLFAYSHSSNWTPGTAQSTTPNFMNDQVVSHQTGSWAYDPLKFWTNDYISFFGYWPIMDGVTKQEQNVGQGDYVSTAKAFANAFPQVEFTQKMDAENMVDFIASHAIDQTRDGGVVTLDFKHVLTRLNFKARLDEALGVDANTGKSSTHVFFKSLKICGTKGSTDPTDKTGATLIANADSKFYKSATFVLGDGSGSGAEANGKWVYDAATTTATINAAVAQDEALDLSAILRTSDLSLTSTTDQTKKYPATGNTVAAIDLNNNGTPTDLLKQTSDATPKQHYVFLIPPHGIQGIQSEKDVIVELEYDIVTQDEKLDEKFTVTPKKYAVSLPKETLKQGVAYNIIFTVGMNPVKVDVNVSDWDQNEITQYAPSVKAANNDATSILAAWDAMNTSKAQTKTANYFVINVDNMPTATLDLRTNVAAATRFSAFKMGDQVELVFKDEDQATAAFSQTVLVPDGWIYEDRTVNGTKRHIITKMSKYATVVASNYNASTTYSTTDFESALDDLNNAYATDTRNYAIDFYGVAPAAALFDMSTVDIDAKLTNFTGKFDQNNIYLVFNEENASGAQTYNAPSGWKIVSTTTPGKYLLKKDANTTGSTTSNISVGDAGFNASTPAININ